MAWSQMLPMPDALNTPANHQWQQTSGHSITRSEFAQALIHALGHKQNQKSFSEFAFYRDVPVTHPAYVPIEMARERKLITYNEHGFYHPDQPITGAEAILGFSNALASKLPSDSATQMILSPYPAWQQAPPATQQHLAKLVTARVLPITPITNYPLPATVAQPTQPGLLALDAPLNQTDMQTLLARLVNITKSRYFFTPPDERMLPPVDGGLTLSIVPTGALFMERMAIGEHLYFVLTDPVGMLPKGSRLEGVVTQKISNTDYGIDFKEIKSPQGQYYRLMGSMTLSFSNSGLIVPGVPYTVVSQHIPVDSSLSQPPAAMPNSRLPLSGAAASDLPSETPVMPMVTE